MDSRPVVWDTWNARHIEEDHPERHLTVADVERALADPERLDRTFDRNGSEYFAVLGQTPTGRLLRVVWVDHPAGRYSIHAHRAGRREAREYYR